MQHIKGLVLLVMCLMTPILGQTEESVLEKNTADILLETDLDHMNVTINPGGSGCSAGRMWDVVVGGCTQAVSLRRQSTTASCTCRCPSGQTGSCTKRRTGRYDVLGWRIPPSGSEVISRNGPISWGSCRTISSSCRTVSPPPEPTPSGPTPGTTLTVTAFICGSSNPNYSRGRGTTTMKNDVLSQYRNFSYYKRCADSGGYVFWQNAWEDDAQRRGGTPADYYASWVEEIRPGMQSAAIGNGEHLPSSINQIDSYCNNFANSRYSEPVTAKYVKNSGDKCVIT